MAFSLVTDSTFKGIAFLDRYSGGQASGDFEVEEQVNLIHVPGSNTNIIQSGGRIQASLTLPIVATGSALDDLENAVGSSGTLSYHGGSRSARLSKVSNRQKVSGHDLYTASLLLYAV